MKARTFTFALLFTGIFALAAAFFVQGTPALSAFLSTSPQWTNDIKVNPAPTVTTAGYQNSSLAISPINANFVVASYDVEDLSKHSGYAASTDRGNTWQSGEHSGPWGTLNLPPDGDTHILFDSAGVVYNTSRATDGTNVGYFVMTSTNGLAWSNALPIVENNADIARNQSFAVIDQRPTGQYAGSIYIFWRYIDLGNNQPQRIAMRYSRDGGHTWSNDIFVSDAAPEDAFRPWAAVAPDGSIYATFTQEDDVDPLNSQKLFLDRSTDGGATWGTDHLITGAPITPVGGVFKHSEIGLEANDTCQPLETFQRAFVTISPVNPNDVYVVWNDGRWDAAIVGCFVGGKHSDIAFSRSTDSGANWTAPVRLNDDTLGNGRDQFQPMINIGHDGTLGVIWYDRRYDTNPYLYNTTYTQSRDSGLTWSPNQRVADVSSDPAHRYNVKGVADLGSREPLVFGPNFVLAGWLDTRIGTQQGDLFIDKSDACTLAFTDMPSGSTFYANIRCLACKDIVTGYPCGGPGEPCDAYANPYFRPSNSVSRGQIAKIVSNAAGFTGNVVGQSFQDIPVGSTFYTYTERLAIRGIMSGYPCGGPGEPCGVGNLPYFRPNSNATRGQISKIVSQAAGFVDPPGSQIFEDVLPGSTFYDYVQRLASRGYMSGYPCGGPGEPCGVGNLPYFRPGNNATRGQVSKIVSNTFFPDCNPPR